MRSGIFKGSVCVSSVLFLGFVAFCAYTRLGGPNPEADTSGAHWHYASLSNKFHVAATSDWGGGLVFFNQAEPYTGSVLGLAGDRSVREKGLTGLGLYFRSIGYAGKDETWWTLIISLWYPLVIFAILPAVWVGQKLLGCKLANRPEGHSSPG
ncbi:MAG TPA: hypothetical protein VGY56_12610 [Verrucomicrobiae bacterium]|nr:hypothetical protein [Verrucomicrobiae bacterium]